MKWVRRKGLQNFEECVELRIDFEARKFTFEYYFNHPMGGGGNSETFAFEEAGGEKFRGLLEYYGDRDFDATFGAGARDRFDRIRQMSKAEYAAENLENLEIVIDRAVDQ
jgi:hypothetical protein